MDEDEFNVFAAALGVEKWNAWAAKRMEKRNKLMTAEEIAKVESYINSVPGEDWEKTSSLFSQSYFNAPAIRLSENQTKAGGKVYTYLFTQEEHSTRPSARPCARCGFNSPRLAIRRSAQTSRLTARPRSGLFMTWVTRM